VNQGQYYQVEEGLQMRGDLISKAFYQSNSLMCLLLKFNSISNPFSLDLNDLIVVPDAKNLNLILVEPDKINGTDDNWQNSTRKKKRASVIQPKTKQDQNRLNFLQSTANSQVAPTNIAKDTSVKVVNGKIVFGADVTSVKKEDCPDPISRTKLLATLLKNKISQ
jgi:hypothetical protein